MLFSPNLKSERHEFEEGENFEYTAENLLAVLNSTDNGNQAIVSFLRRLCENKLVCFAPEQVRNAIENYLDQDLNFPDLNTISPEELAHQIQEAIKEYFNQDLSWYTHLAPNFSPNFSPNFFFSPWNVVQLAYARHFLPPTPSEESIPYNFEVHTELPLEIRNFVGENFVNYDRGTLEAKRFKEDFSKFLENILNLGRLDVPEAQSQLEFFKDAFKQEEVFYFLQQVLKLAQPDERLPFLEAFKKFFRMIKIMTTIEDAPNGHFFLVPEVLNLLDYLRQAREEVPFYEIVEWLEEFCTSEAYHNAQITDEIFTLLQNGVREKFGVELPVESDQAL